MSIRIHEQLFYEIAMSIGNSLELEQMLQQALVTYLRKLNCRAGMVLRERPREENAAEKLTRFDPVYVIPKKVAANPLMQKALSFVPQEEKPDVAAHFRTMLPLFGRCDNTERCARGVHGSYYIFDLPDFGLLVLAKSGDELTWKEIRAMAPLNTKLARACVSCVQSAQLQQLNKKLQSEIEERCQAEEKYRSFFKNAVEGIFRSSMQGRMLEVNPAMAKMLGYDSTEELLLSLGDMRRELYVQPSDRDTILSQLQQHGEVSRFETPFRRKDGSQVWAAISARLVRDARGHVQHIEGICEDVTASIETRQALQRAKEEAEKLSHIKSSILSMVSHELRTPLTSILGFAHLMEKLIREKVAPHVQEDALSANLDRVMDNLNIVSSESRRLTTLINNVLDLSKLESGRMEWDMELVPLDDVIEHSLAALRPSFETRKIQLERDVQPALPEVLGDRDRLVQVCINLLSNAIKFTPAGGRVTCSAAQAGNSVRVSVQDTGAGIPLEHQQSVFDVFRQVGDTLTGKPEGSGLGLAICKEIVEHHGGRIWVESAPGSGSVFSFTLPVEGGASSSDAP